MHRSHQLFVLACSSDSLVLSPLPNNDSVDPKFFSNALALPPSPILLLPIGIIRSSPFQVHTVDERLADPPFILLAAKNYCGFVIQ